VLPLIKFVHLAAAITWMGGISFMLFALRPAAGETLQPPQRLSLIAATLQRFFRIVRIAIALLFLSGLAMLLNVGMKNAPHGWHVMFGFGLLMFALFGRIESGPFRRLKSAVVACDWPTAGAQVTPIARLAMAIFALGWVAIAAMRFIP
jgi:uncharacterized membrane protein